MPMDKDTIEKYIKDNLEALPIHARFWSVNNTKANQTIRIPKNAHNGLIRPDLMHKPVSTFFELKANADEK